MNSVADIAVEGGFSTLNVLLNNPIYEIITTVY
jgi:hypothetical protein